MGALFHPLSVKSKAALVTTAGVLVLFATFAVFEMHRVQAEMQAVLGAQQLTLLSSIADELDDKVRSTHKALIVTAEATTPKMLADPPALERNLRDQPGYRSLFDDVFVIGRDGRVLIDLPVLKRRGIDVHDRDYFRGTLDTRKPVISAPYMGRGLKEPSVTMTAPILDRKGEVAGMLTGVIHPLKANFLGKLREARVGATGRFILFSRDRTVIVSRDVDRIMTKGPEPGVRSYLDKALAGREGWEESTNSRGQRALYSYKPLASVPWVLVAVLPVEEAYAPIAAAQTRAVGIAALLALLLAPLVWFGMQYVLSPIGVLRDTIRRIRSDPESEALVQMPRQDELGDLAEDFNAMTRERQLANQALRESEERYRSLAELSSDWYWEQDEHYRFLPLTGHDTHAKGHLWRGEQAAKTRWDLPDTDLTEEQWAKHRALLDARQPFHDFEYSRVGSDGERHYVRISGEPILDAHGKFKGYRGVGKDVTERKRAENLQRQSEERFAKIFQSSPAAIVISRLKDGRYLDVNQRWIDIFGYTREEIMGHSSLDLGIWVDPADRTRFVEQIRGRGALQDFEVRFRKKSGAIIYGLISAELIEIDGEPHVIVPVQDVTERKAAEEELRLKDNAIATSINGIAIADTSGRIFYVNQTFVRMWGYADESEIIGKTPEDFTSDPVEARVMMQQFLERGSYVGEFAARKKDGVTFTAQISASVIKNTEGRLTHLMASFLDISERKRTETALRQSEALFKEFAENTPDIFWIRDLAGNFLYVSPRWEKMIGHPSPKRRGDILSIVHPDDIERVSRDMEKLPRGGIDHEYRIVRLDGSVRWLRVHTFPVLDAEGEVYRVAAISEDISQRKEDELRLLQLAHYDNLTNLPNRVLFYDMLKRALVQAGEGRWSVAVLFVDLDRFKEVNDALGHAVGDELLRQVAARLLDCVRIRDVVSRLGGDEFGVMLLALNSPDEATAVADKLLHSILRPFVLEGREVFVTASIGVTIFPADGTDADELQRFADTAMYLAKREGRNTYRFYTAEMNARAEERFHLENALRIGLDRNEFLLHYQPKIEFRSRRISGLEALLRWQSPDKGLVLPVDFVALLEETGLIVPVGDWVVLSACRQIRAWRDAGLGSVKVALNLSARQFFEKDLCSKIVRTAKEFGVDPELIELEITESSLMSHARNTISILHEMRAAGFRLTVDDFGTGYSSLSYLKRFPINTVKIDRSFVRDIPGDPDDTGIVRAILSMAHTLKLSVVAEGVETAEQFEFLRSLDCDEAQGYYLAWPMDSGAVTKLLQERS